MSFAALALASKYRAESAAEKLVLFAYADRHNEETGCAYPSIAWLCEFTSLNRKTVIAAVLKLERVGILSDTGNRQGSTRQIKVYRVNLQSFSDRQGEQHYVYRLSDHATGEFYIGVRSFLGDPQKDSYKGSGRWPTGAVFHGKDLDKQILAVFATRNEAEQEEARLIEEAMQHPLCKNIAKEYLKRARYKTVPILDNSTENGRKESQKRDTEPVRNQPSTDASHPTKARASKSKVLHFRMPDDWKPVRFADDTVARAVIDRRGIEWGRAALESFRNWAANADDKPGAGRKLNWQAAWAKWVIEQDKRDGQQRPLRTANDDGLGRTARAALRAFPGATVGGSRGIAAGHG